jgi:hypothetical protein
MEMTAEDGDNEENFKGAETVPSLLMLMTPQMTRTWMLPTMTLMFLMMRRRQERGRSERVGFEKVMSPLKMKVIRLFLFLEEESDNILIP